MKRRICLAIVLMAAAAGCGKGDEKPQLSEEQLMNLAVAKEDEPKPMDNALSDDNLLNAADGRGGVANEVAGNLATGQ